MPQNIEAERGVLGSIIIDPEAIVQVADFLTAEDFYRDAHRTIYEVIVQLYEQREAADFITICDELERRNRLEDVGGASYITSLINQVPTSGNVEYYGRIVERTAILRRLIHAAGEIAAIAYDEVDANLALEKAEQLIFSISQRHAHSDFSLLRDILSDYMNKLDQLHERRGTIVGVPTGFTDLDRLTGGLQKSDLIILAARPAMGKCLPAWTLIDHPETGERLTIEEYVRRQIPVVHSLSDSGKIQISRITDWVDSGVQPCYRVRTRLGRMVEVTGHHPFLTIHGWTPLHDLKEGQYIAVPTHVQCFGSDESWPIEKVRLLAYYIAEGGLTHACPYFTNTDPIIVEDFKHIIATQFPTLHIRQYRIDYSVSQPKNAETMRGRGGIFPKNPVTVWLTELGLMGKLAQDKRFPACVWKWSKRYLAEFLRALMSCDGSIYALKETKNRPIIEFTVTSQQLATDVYHAFLRFGILAKYYQKTDKAWCVQITATDGVKKYQEQIGWIGEKSMRFANSIYVGQLKGRNNGHAPVETWQLVRSASQEKGLSLSELARRSGETEKVGKYAGYNAHTNRTIPSRRLAAYAEVLEDTALQRIASPDIYWDEIVSIEPIGEHHVYDLTVPEGANFIAQDVFVHNTSLALSLAHNSAIKHQRSIAVFSLEMSKEQLVQRLLSMDAAVDQQRLRTGWIEDEDWERIIYSMGTLSEANIWIDDTAGISTVEMRSKARSLQAEHGIDLIIVDYLQLMQSSVGGKRNENRVMEISEISRNLKGLARELNIPVVALAQLSRAVESRQSKVPQLSDLRESGCITGDSQVYLPDEGIYRPIEQLVGQKNFRVLALNTETWRLKSCTVSNAFATGCKPIYRMTTKLGRAIRATGNHKFLTVDGWKRLDELSLEDSIAVPRKSFAIDGLIQTGTGGRPHGSPFSTMPMLSMRGDGRPQGATPHIRVQQQDGRPQGATPHIRVQQQDGRPQGATPHIHPTPVPTMTRSVVDERHIVGTGAVLGGGVAPCGRPSPFNGAGGVAPRGRPSLFNVTSGYFSNARNVGVSAQSDVYWDEIIAIEADGEAEVYDLTVDELHNFVADDMIVHNSIEQDADIVMFIYRDDVYNPESERKNIADIIIAKHRNGPVGEVSLYFQANQTRFHDLEITPPAE